jgi:hypothetical protein
MRRRITRLVECITTELIVRGKLKLEVEVDGGR